MAKQQKQRPQPVSKKAAPAPARRSDKRERLFNTDGNDVLIFGRKNFILMGAGFLLILLGLAAMSGGAMPDPNKWEPERIYSPIRITLAPLMMVAGFIVIVLGIFKRSDGSASGDNAEAAS
ncbi:MAG: DUF3098 domain-containing protein [Lewinellaceae bacterium]|nr:DUF3098 domain-containing protein [Saprospiraceae bacterium]MCB9342718.1 DUF3098 domain-containing protein [Lewinellaceae bacterium]